jgi:hypothetical protein
MKMSRAAVRRIGPVPDQECASLHYGQVTAVSGARACGTTEDGTEVEARCSGHIDRGWLAAAVAVAPVDALFVLPPNGTRFLLLAVFPGEEHDDVRADLRLRGRKVVIEGDEVRLQSKHAHVAVARAGAVEVRGKDITSRATRINRIQGGAIRLN